MLKHKLLPILTLLLCSGCLLRAQDSQSLGDAARQARQQRRDAQNASPENQSPTSAKAQHVVTNDEIPEHDESSDVRPQGNAIDPATSQSTGKRPAEYWKAQILRMKNGSASLQSNIERVSNSIHFSGGNYDEHVLWNQRQRQKQQQVESMKSQLSQLQKRLEEMQEAARHQGYGSSVYDP